MILYLAIALLWSAAIGFAWALCRVSKDEQHPSQWLVK